MLLNMCKKAPYFAPLCQWPRNGCVVEAKLVEVRSKETKSSHFLRDRVWAQEQFMKSLVFLPEGEEKSRTLTVVPIFLCSVQCQKRGARVVRTGLCIM